MASPLDHLGRAFAGALSAVAAVGDEARRRAEGARDAVVSTIAAVQQQRSNDVDASSAMHRQRRRRPFAGVASVTMHQQQQHQPPFVPVSTEQVRSARWGPSLSDLADAAATSSSSSSAATEEEEAERAANPPPGPPDLLLRLSSVPVYAVVNKKDEFVLVTGGGGGGGGGENAASQQQQQKELGLLFMSESGARALAEKVKKEAKDKRVARDVVVARTSLDRVYSLAAAAQRPAGAEDVSFRFVPEARQVERAVSLVREGIVSSSMTSASKSASQPPPPPPPSEAALARAVPGFAGVPVFQAAGLSVSSDARRYTPLFLDARDLDEAVRGAAAARDAAAAAAEADASAAALRAAQDRLDAIPDKDAKRRKQAEEALEAASARAAAAGERGVVKGMGGPPPPVEVGCLEAVLAEMASERSGDGPWSGAMIVPPGALAARAAAAAAAAAAKGKKK